MQITYKTLVNSVESFRQFNELDFMPRTALNLYKLSKFLDNELGDFQKLRNDLSEKYKDDAFSQEATDAFEELLETTIDINFDKIPFSVVERTNRSVKPSMFINLEWVIDLEEEEAKPEEGTEEKPSE